MQLENATEKQSSAEEKEQNDIDDDDNDEAIEMSEDFEGTVMDLPECEEEEHSSDDDGEDNDEDLADKMGDLGKKEHEGLDKNMWAPEDQDNQVLFVVEYLYCA